MNEFIDKKPKQTVDKVIQKALDESREKIKAEMEKSGNRWLACFISRISVINFSLLTGRNEMSTEKFEAIKTKLNLLKENVYNLQEKFEDDIPNELKERLFEELFSIVK